MHSKELAELAGVTVRTLRHYHQIGVLAEPERSAGGYRSYTVRHLVTVIRIVRLTELGIPLGEVARVIDDPVASAELLEHIDLQAAAEIDRLTARRASIAALRGTGASPDLPAALVPHLALLNLRRASTVREEVHGWEQVALLRHLSEDATMSWLAVALENLSRSGARYTRVVDAFADLPPDAPAAEVAALAREVVDLVGSAVARTEVPELGAEASALVLSHSEEVLNESQRRVMRQVLDALETESPGAPEAGPDAEP